MPGLLTSFTPANVRTGDYTGEVGMGFSLTQTMTFNQFGMYCATPGEAFVVVLYETVSRKLIDSQSITGAVAGQFTYAPAPTGLLTLTVGTNYTLVARVATDTRHWVNSSPCAIQNKSSLTAVYLANYGGPWVIYTANQSYCGLDLSSSVNYADLAGNLAV